MSTQFLVLAKIKHSIYGGGVVFWRVKWYNIVVYSFVVWKRWAYACR